MTDSSPQSNPNAVPGAADVPAAAEGQQQQQEQRRGRGDRDGRRGDRRGGRRGQERDSEWQERVVQIRRVSKTVKGGKKMSFRAIVVVGNEKGQVGVGVGKAGDVIGAVRRALPTARSSWSRCPLPATTPSRPSPMGVMVLPAS